METLRNSDRKWESILKNLKILKKPGTRNWCITEGTFNRCVPTRLETHDGVPYKCLKRGGKGGYGEVLIYGRTDPDTGKNQKIAIKVMKYAYDSECQNTSTYYFSEERKLSVPTVREKWCPYVVVQKCITPKNGFYCDFKRIKVEVIAMEIMGETLDKFLEKHNSPAVKEAILRKIYIALLCMWKNGAVYSDMKPENVMVNQVRPVENSIVKLVDLGSICTDIGRRSAICTYPPPHTWAFFNGGRAQNPVKSGCTEKTLIWEFAIAALSVYAWDKWNEHWDKLVFNSPDNTDTIVGDRDVEPINDWMEYFEGLLDKEDSSGILNNVRKCFAPFRRDGWEDDWRTSRKPPPFKFSTMLPEPVTRSRNGYLCLSNCFRKQWSLYPGESCGCETAPYGYLSHVWDYCDEDECKKGKKK